MRALLSRLPSLAGAYFLELTTLAAVGGIAFGVSLIFLPAGIIVGCVLLLAAIIDSRR